DWTSFWISLWGGDEFLTGLLDDGYSCELGAYECTSTSVDSDEDGICDEQELWQGWNPQDANSPFETEVTSVVEMESAIALFPNPFTSSFQLNGLNAGDRVEVFSTAGQMIAQFRVNGERETIETSAWTSGLYFVRCLDQSGNLITSQSILKD
ncbi:MAG: T9SS type A sorting domain-containing protein, partial [Flavobacteriales bacterium]|nr:T9SS type A sorting domain-containing protein [Flavobacteriales bacterium]